MATKDRLSVDVEHEADASLTEDAARLRAATGELVRVVQFRDRDRVCCYDVSASQCYALRGVVEAGSLTVNELAAHLYLDKSTASRLANSLVEKGYLNRERNREDGRVVELVPTHAGAALSEAIRAGEVLEYAQLLEDFTPEVRSEVVRLVRELGRCFARGVEASGGTCSVSK